MRPWPALILAIKGQEMQSALRSTCCLDVLSGPRAQTLPAFSGWARSLQISQGPWAGGWRAHPIRNLQDGKYFNEC